jgi:hypothetical protein
MLIFASSLMSTTMSRSQQNRHRARL